MTIEEDSGVIYGLDFQARTMCSVQAEQERVDFLIGTQSLKSENQVCLINLDEDTNGVSKTSYSHPAGEVWHLSASPSNKNLIATCHAAVSGTKTVNGCTVWKLSDEASPGNGVSQLELVSTLDSPDSFVSCFEWQPSGGSKALVFHGNAVSVVGGEFKGRNFKIESSTEFDKKSAGKTLVGRWNPHHDSNTYAVVCDAAVRGWDIRSNEETFCIEQAHNPVVRSLDFNPNRQYFLSTAGDDCKVKFWDTRQPSQPLFVFSKHSHWVWAVRFNPIHDQLVLSCSSDARVCLQSLVSLSSERFEEQEETSEFGRLEDGVIRVMEEHEESVYACDWSASDPWVYASLSYDGRVLINRVPRSVKYKILQL